MPTEDKTALVRSPLFEQGAGSSMRVSQGTVVKGLAASPDDTRTVSAIGLNLVQISQAG